MSPSSSVLFEPQCSVEALTLWIEQLRLGCQQSYETQVLDNRLETAEILQLAQLSAQEILQQLALIVDIAVPPQWLAYWHSQAKVIELLLDLYPAVTQLIPPSALSDVCQTHSDSAQSSSTPGVSAPVQI
jgi:hypothetical protein